jgi:hypothetical protein
MASEGCHSKTYMGIDVTYNIEHKKDHSPAKVTSDNIRVDAYYKDLGKKN